MVWRRSSIILACGCRVQFNVGLDVTGHEVGDEFTCQVHGKTTITRTGQVSQA